MKSLVEYAETFQEVSITNIPVGEYRGIWGGYYAEIKVGEKLYRLKTKEGIRTPSAECLVTQNKLGEILVQTIRGAEAGKEKPPPTPDRPNEPTKPFCVEWRDEIEAMMLINKGLEGFGCEACERILNWARAAFVDDPRKETNNG